MTGRARVTVSVTMEDIALATKEETPIAKAIQRVMRMPVRTTETTWAFTDDVRNHIANCEYALPPEAIIMQRAWELTGKMEPVKFTLELPQAVGFNAA